MLFHRIIKYNIFMKHLKLIILSFLFLNCSNSDNNSYENQDPIDPVQENIFFISQVIDGIQVDREVLIHLPEDFDSTIKYPVVIAFHGGGGQNDHWFNKFSPFVQNGEFIGIYPQGYLNSWNLGQEASTADEVYFLHQIMARLETYSFFDPSRVYGIGTSNGSALINKLAIETSYFSAIVALASQLIQGTVPNSSTSPVSVLQICGTDDQSIPYDGGMAFMGHNFLSAHDSALAWAGAFNCSIIPIIEDLENDMVIVYTDCESGKEIRFHSVTGGDHSLNQQSDPEFYHRIWDFLKRF